MNLGLEGNAFIVSGSSRGIGKAIAAALLDEQAGVMLTGRDEAALQSTYAEFAARFPGQVAMCPGDLNDDQVLRRVEAVAVARWPRLAGVVANAGAVRGTADWNPPESDWEWNLRANFEVGRRFVSHFVPHLKQDGGSIVVINSIAALADVGAPLPYSAAKAALLSWTGGLARRLAPAGIRINTIAPGNILFPGGNWEKRRGADPEGIERMLRARVPLQRFGSPEEIGNLAAFLLSGKAAFITGSCIVADGGQTAGLHR